MLLQQIMHLYRGDFLAETFRFNTLDFEAWMLAIREEVRIQARTVLAHLALDAFHRSTPDQAAHYARRMVALDPLHETSQRLCMYLLAHMGERTAAIAQYDMFRQMLDAELGIQPEAATTRLYAQICAGALNGRVSQVTTLPTTTSSPTAPTPLTGPSLDPIWNLPTPLTPFFGREEELTQLATLLQRRAYRLITLLGPGGTGKTRLALQAATLQRHAFRHGVCFVPLLDVASAEELAGAVVNALGLPHLSPTPAYDQLCTYLCDKELLLLLDNLEHLSGVTDLLLNLLRHAPKLLLLVTSRKRLGVQAEDVLVVPGLALPTTDDIFGITAAPAVQLFQDRARRVQKNLQINAQTLPAILHICRLVEGLPLAIELAAAWVRVRSCVDIARDLERGLDVLAADWHDLPARHRSIRALFDQSWSLLTAEEQRVLRGMAVFHGGCTASAAQAITGASPAILAGLVDTSFVRRTANGRYTQHPLTWHYAREQLEATPAEYAQLHARHAHYYAIFLQECSMILRGPQEMQMMADIDADLDNIRTAWFWAVEHEAVLFFQHACASLCRYYEMRGNDREGERLFAIATEVLQRLDPHGRNVRGQLLACRGLFALRLGDYQQAEVFLQQSLDLLPADRYAQERIYALHYAGALNCLSGRFDDAHPKLLECLAIARNSGDRWECAYALMALGLWHALVGQHQIARQHYEASQQEFSALGDQRYVGRVQGLLGATLYVLGHADTARQYLQASLHRLRELRDSPHFSCIQVQIMLTAPEVQHHATDLIDLVHAIMESARAFGDEWVYTRALIVLADVAHMQGDTEAEEKHLRLAAHLASTNQIILHVLMALIRWARLLSRGDSASRTRALELLAYALQHPLLYQGDRPDAQRLLVALESTLPPAVATDARQRAQESSLERLVDTMRSPLGELFDHSCGSAGRE